MTSEEARQRLDVCENQITGAYSNLHSAARNTGLSAVQAAAAKTRRNTLLALLISLFGLILCFASHPVYGILLIIAGIAAAYYAYQLSSDVQREVEKRHQNLESVINNNTKI